MTNPRRTYGVTHLVAGPDFRRLGIAAEAGRGQWGLAVLTALPVTGYDVADLGPTPGEKMSRAAQLVTVTTPDGASLRVVNTHLTYRLFSPVQLVRLTRRLVERGADRDRRGPQHARAGQRAGGRLLARGAGPDLPGPPAAAAARPDAHQRGSPGPRRKGAAPAGSDHLPIRARLRVV